MARKKTDERAWEEELRSLLPVEPDDNTLRFAERLDDICPPLIIYGRESVPDNNYELQFYGLPIEREKWHWGGSCTCTTCGETFYTGWKEGKIAITQMEDGNLLEGWIRPDEDYETMLFGEGEEIPCPHCGAFARLARRSKIRGRTFRTRIAELTNLGSTTCILYWYATRWLDKQGFGRVQFEPFQAVALSSSGRLLRFGFEWQTHRWWKLSKFRDPEEIPYSEGGNMWNRYSGAYLFNNAGSMAGVTGEKTGIDSYFAEREAGYAADYLKRWKETPTIEALVKTGGAAIAADYVRERRNWQQTTNTSALNFREKKPHRITGLKKEEYRFITEDRWQLALLEQFQIYRNYWPKTTVQEFSEYAHYLDERRMEEFKKYYPDNLGRICRYLEKHRERENTGYYLDYRRMLTELKLATGAEALTDEEKFPRDLIAAHDRVLDALTAVRNEQRREGTPDQVRTFAGLKEKYAPLEWKDGKFCIIIPECPEDLVREGDVLHHCVGGYASQHCRGQMIFFVRHARRPERSWYTLNEDVNGAAVRRIQLHGYKNEYAHGKTLTIPKEVTDFVQRWENEILAPYLKKRGRIPA